MSTVYGIWLEPQKCWLHHDDGSIVYSEHIGVLRAQAKQYRDCYVAPIDDNGDPMPILVADTAPLYCDWGYSCPRCGNSLGKNAGATCEACGWDHHTDS